jgi:hypothetical protein
MPDITEKVSGGSLFALRSGILDFNLAARELALRLSLGDAGSLPVMSGPLAAGAQVHLSATLAGDQTLRQASVDFAGAAYSTLYTEGTLEFSAQPIIIPADGPTALHLNTPFTFEGTLSAFHNDPFAGDAGPAVFRAHLHGHGTATLRCSATRHDAELSYRELSSLFYAFEH